MARLAAERFRFYQISRTRKVGRFLKIQSNKVLHAWTVRRRWIAALLCLSILAGLGIVSLLTVTGQAKTYVDKVPDFHLLPSGGPGSVDYAAHVHDEDCCEGETLVRRLPVIRAHYHSESCCAEEKSLQKMANNGKKK